MNFINYRRMEIFLSENCSDYMAWKAAHLLEPNYHSLYDIGLLIKYIIY